MARDNVLRLTGDYRYRANILLHEALCMLVKGMRRAVAVIDTLSPAYRSRHIIEAVPAAPAGPGQELNYRPWRVTVVRRRRRIQIQGHASPAVQTSQAMSPIVQTGRVTLRPTCMDWLTLT
ncbi:hypothetical protein OIE13_28965 [Streptosporangium sp. NBC_01810]|uniref:hypothetical protein n=1 Tax=Streptosporangium sp. NBC_01810 TaxID=2975951 RepID=UPI002DDA1F95|nr:hypothetical protein [Streptosporangium sp. NBC_01810]WSA24930.1 hypothetical protein OIE13_28965 [Streptosporangium sp. NBC_01810]